MQIMRAMWLWVQVLGGLVAAVAVCWLVVQSMFHLRLLNVQTGSMRPSFGPGDALVMQHIAPERLRPGMVVSYKSSRNPNALVTHRVVRVQDGSFQTKGDAVRANDPAVQNGLLVGSVVAVLPGMGRLLGWLTSWPGLVVCVYAPAIAMVASELHRLERSYRLRQVYRLNVAPGVLL